MPSASARRRPRKAAATAPDDGRPELVAAVDVGATAVRLVVAELAADGRPVPVENLVHPIALGADTFRLGHLRPETVRALGRVLGNFASVAGGYPISARRCVATSAVREASNADMVVDRVRHASGMTMEVIDAVEESRLAYQILVPTLAEFLGDPRRYSLVLSLGGGMTEIMLLEGRDLAFATSRRLGTARLRYAAAGADDFADAGAVLDAMARNIVHSALDLYREYPVTQLIVNNSQLARAARLQPGGRAHDHGAVLPADAARALAAADAPPDQLARRFGMRLSDGELLAPALLTLRRILETVPAEETVLADVDTISAIVDELARERRGGRPRFDFHRQTVRSAHALGARYRYPREHSEQVARLSLRLFDELADFLDLAPPDRSLLEVAAILHDIGMYVSEHAHHKHGAYLVRWSEIVGVKELDRIVVSQVIRYHRRALPSTAHEDFMALPPEVRLRVQKLAALLRIADALDRGHAGGIVDVRVEMGDRDITLVADMAGSGGLAVEAAALPDKGKLLELMTGLSLRLRRRVPDA